MGDLVYNSLEGSIKGHLFRLLTLHPAQSPDDPILCSLAESSLDNPPSYEALSYCWGDPSDPRPIRCNDRCFHATRNLFSALGHLRLVGADRVLWVDAICINQADKLECASQVGLMRDIYSKAESVVIWFGEEAQGSALVFPMCERLEAHRGDLLSTEDLRKHIIEYFWGRGKSRIRRNLRDLQEAKAEEQRNPETGEASLDFDPTSAETDALISLIKRPWFSRCWVIQELCLGRSTTVMCGESTTSWGVFFAGFLITALFDARVMQAIGRADAIYDQGVFRMFSLWASLYAHTHEVSDGPPMMDLLGLLWATQTFNATDSRDKVYSLLGLVNEEWGPLKVNPDYTISNSECFHRTACAILDQTKTLDLLVSDHKPRQTTTENLPSWVPDWSSKSPSSPTLLFFNERREPRNWQGLEGNSETSGQDSTNYKNNPYFLACGANAASYEPVLLDDNRTLIVSGFVIDRIAVLQDTLVLDIPKAQLDGEALKKDEVGVREVMSTLGTYFGHMYTGMGGFLDTFVRWEQLALDKTYASYPSTREDPLHVFVNTLCLGDMPEGPDARLAQYQDWMRRLTGPRKLARLGDLGGGAYRESSLYRIAMGVSGSTSLVAGALFRSAFRGHDIRAEGSIDRTFTTAMERTLNRRLARLGDGFLGLVPAESRVGDAVALLWGGKVPFVVREVQAGGSWELIGPAYVHGMMHGEKWDESRCVDIDLV